MRLSDLVGDRLANFIHSPVSTYTSGAISAGSGIGAVLSPHNLVFFIGTFGGLFFAWLTYRSRKRRDLEAILREREAALLDRARTDALIEFLQSHKDSIKNVDEAPEVVHQIVQAVREGTERVPD